MNDVALDPPGTLLGQLQRGRGSAARGAAATRGAGDLVYDCLRRDPRWDRQIESRGLYYARLMVDLELPVVPVAEHLLDSTDLTDRDEWRTSLALTVLADLVRLSRRDAAEPLRRYAADGWNWYEALDLLVGLDDPCLADGFDEVAVARCDDEDLLGLALRGNSLVESWAGRHRRIGQALETLRARRETLRLRRKRTSAPPSSRSDTDLLRQALGARTAAAPTRASPAEDRAPADRGLTAIIELGRRRSPLVLDLAEELLPSRCRAAVSRALRDLGPVAVPRARTWATAEHDHFHLGIGILARHGTEQDVPALLTALRRALGEQDWAAAARPVEGLGRLQAPAATPLLHAAWQATQYSYLRPRLLAAIGAQSRAAASPLATEALWDCEDQTRRHGIALTPMTAETTLRLHRLAAETAEDPPVRTAAMRRLRRRAGTGKEEGA